MQGLSMFRPYICIHQTKIMKPLFRKIILLFICFMPLLAGAQDAKAKMDASPAAKKAQRQKAKQKWKETRIVEHENKKAVKAHHKRLQTKKTLKMMKKEKKKSEKLRANKKDNFFQRLFKR